MIKQYRLKKNIGALSMYKGDLVTWREKGFIYKYDREDWSNGDWLGIPQYMVECNPEYFEPAPPNIDDYIDDKLDEFKEGLKRLFKGV